MFEGCRDTGGLPTLHMPRDTLSSMSYIHCYIKNFQQKRLSDQRLNDLLLLYKASHIASQKPGDRCGSSNGEMAWAKEG
jgi:hypothetical protein